MMIKYILRFLSNGSFACLLFSILSQSASAVDTAGGFGGVADNLMVPVEVLSSIMSGASIVIGLTCLFGALIRYMQYRVNPLANPISTVITLLVLGIVLLCLPLIYKFTDSGIPSSFSFSSF